jgi:hypothetical protein
MSVFGSCLLPVGGLAGTLGQLHDRYESTKSWISGEGGKVMPFRV